MYPYDRFEGHGAATLFKDSECRNQSGYIEASDPGVTVGYNCSELHQRNIGNDEVSSVMIPVGYTLTLCRDDGFINCNLTM